MYATVVAAGVIVFLLLSLLASNWLHKKTGNFVFSRKLAHILSGLAILAAPLLFDSPVIPVSIALVGLALFITTHSREVFHGVQRKGRLSEVYFAISVTICLASWWLIGPWIGVAAALFLAWGDAVTGLVRFPLYRTQFEKGWMGSLAMLVVCLLITLLVTPYWIGVVGAFVATLLERQRILDDNLAAPLGALLVMGALYAV